MESIRKSTHNMKMRN